MKRTGLLLVTAALAMLLAGGVTFLGMQKPAEAAFPGKNGRIAFVSARGGDADIYTVKPGGSGLQQITHNTATESGPAWSPDGTKIAFASNMDGHDREIYVRDLRSGQTTQLTDNSVATNPEAPWWSQPISDISPAWSPDGTKIVFSSNRNADVFRECDCMQLHVMNADGSDQRGLSDSAWEEWAAAWSPDGTRIAYMAGTEGLFHIWAMNPDGSGAKNLTPLNTGSPIELYPDWSPDGQKITFTRESTNTQSEGGIWKMNSDGSNMQQLTSTQAADAYSVWSPSGREIVFSRTVYDSTYGGGTVTSDIFKMSANGTGLKRITNTPSAREYDLDWQRIP